VQDYYAFGMQMPGRKLSGGYRYGFNGQERSDEIAEGLFSAEYWEYDGRIGRRWNVDPIDKEYESPYASIGNNPIWFTDPNGLDTVKSRSGANSGDIYNFKGTWLHMGEKGGWWDENGTAYTFRSSKKAGFFDAPSAVDKFQRIKTDNAWELYKRSGEKRMFATSMKGIQYIIDWEAYYKKVYNDDVGHATIGYGSLLHRGNYNLKDLFRFPNGVSKEQAFTMLLDELQIKELAVSKALETHKIKVTQQQWDAIMAFVYNLGAGKITNGLTTRGSRSSMANSLLNNLDDANIMTATFMKYTWAKDDKTKKSIQLRGLIKRRGKEADIFVHGVYNSIH
jgi:RHS repeat-associated protein